MTRHRSLRWRITLGLIAFQVSVLVIVSALMVGIFFNASPSGVIIGGEALHAAARSVGRDEEGRLALSPTEQLTAIQGSYPDFWFVVQTESGERLTFGPAPASALGLMDDAPRIKVVDIRGADDDPLLTARLERIRTSLGDLTVLAGGGGFLSDFVAALFLGNIVIGLPTLVLILLTVIGIPLFIRLSLRSVSRLSKEMAKIDFQSRGIQLPLHGLPKEVVPVVEGMNEALRRIDAGVELTERFFMNAAHELRTPMAILQVRLDALPAGPEREKLHHVVRRLTTLVNQLLELERFRQSPLSRDYIDLGSVVSEVSAEVAPYAVSEGYDFSLEAPDGPVWVEGDRQALDRMVMNLVQNAIQHGGRRGAITVRLTENGMVEIHDHGPGIPRSNREKIFEPFFRANPQGSGAGLGLKMVRDIARAHGGEVMIADTSMDGTTFRVSLPIRPQSEVHEAIRNGQYLTPGDA